MNVNAAVSLSMDALDLEIDGSGIVLRMAIIRLKMYQTVQLPEGLLLHSKLSFADLCVSRQKESGIAPAPGYLDIAKPHTTDVQW